MPETDRQTKIGVQVDKTLYQRFVQYVQEKHGKKRGVLGAELEKAMRKHMRGRGQTEISERVEQDLQEIKMELGIATTQDGGVTPARSEPAHTHTNSICKNEGETDDENGVDGHDFEDAPTEVPGRKAPYSKKAAYIFERLGEDGIIVNLNVLHTIIDDAWGFGDRATENLIQTVLTKYNAKMVRRSGNESWGVALGRTVDDREDAIQDMATDTGVEFAQGQDGKPVTGQEVADKLL